MKLENINDELPFVLKKILGHEKFTRQETPKDKRSISKLMNYLKQVPSKLVLDVLHRYKDDFEIFDYQMPTTEHDLLNLLNVQ